MHRWWAVLGSNQWPLPCETEVGCLQINDMRVGFPIATGSWYHVMSRDITRRHELTVPELSQSPLSDPDRAFAIAEIGQSRRTERREVGDPLSHAVLAQGGVDPPAWTPQRKVWRGSNN